jgi:DNA-binding Lrp family transcriptional regulator
VNGVELTDFEKRLCNALQNGLPIVERPFAWIARSLHSSENTVISKTRGLVKKGFIRRFGAVINWRAIGKFSTLVTSHIEKENLSKVVKSVNALDGVSHNYLRNHHFNLWFTLRGDSQQQVDAVLKKLSKHFKAKFFSLPVIKAFKLDVRFDAQSGGKRLLPQNLEFRIENEELRDKEELSWVDKRILKKLQEGIKVVKRPFAFFKDDFENYDCLIHLSGMISEGVIYRIGAIANQRSLGFAANAMFVCKVGRERVVKAGEKLSRINNVSHCYERSSFKGWPYNLFGMCHGRSLVELRQGIEKFVKAKRIKKWELLETVERLKK